jgi:hypothetical protein
MVVERGAQPSLSPSSTAPFRAFRAPLMVRFQLWTRFSNRIAETGSNMIRPRIP